MNVMQTDPMVFRPPRLRRGLQLAVGLPLSAVVLLPTLFAVWLVWAPHVVELEIDDGRLHITTAPAPVSRHRIVDLANVVSVEERHLGRGRRIAGTGLPGYYTGTYRVDGANTKIFTTSIEEGVLIEGPGVRVFVNPENERGFLDAIRSMGGATA